MKTLTKQLLLLVAIISLGFMAQSCKTSKNAENSKNASLERSIEGTWVLSSFEGSAVANSFKGKIPAMTINPVTKTINGNAGCNQYNGAYTLKGDSFTAPNLASTMMACMEENAEHKFHSILAKPSKISVKEGLLTLEQDGKIVAQFVRGIDLYATAGTWTLKSINGKDAKKLFPTEDRRPTIEFFIAENKIGGNAGCNRYNATYSVEGTTINVEPIMTTRMACPDLEGESAFTKALVDVSTLTITDKELIFTKGGKETLRFTHQ